MQPQEQSVVKIGQLEIRYLMDGTVTGAGVGMFELTVLPGARVPPAHSQRDMKRSSMSSKARCARPSMTRCVI
jgi:hypothetical protein